MFGEKALQNLELQMRRYEANKNAIFKVLSSKNKNKTSH